jgi:hypothetical protein
MMTVSTGSIILRRSKSGAKGIYVMTRYWCWWLILLSVTAYIACLPLVAFSLVPGPSGGWTSWHVLIYGWIGLVAASQNAPHLIWLANPVLLVGWVLVLAALTDGSSRGIDGSSRGIVVAAVWASGFALAIAAFSLRPIGIVDNEGGVAVPIVSRGAGYWLWLLSMVCAFASAILLPVRSASEPNPLR